MNGEGEAERVATYDQPLIYDVVNTPGTAGEVTALERIARKLSGESTRRTVWVEPGSGSGRYLRVLAGRGRACVGVDLLPAMVAYAQADLERLGLTKIGASLVGDMRAMDSAGVKRAVKRVAGGGGGKEGGKPKTRISTGKGDTGVRVIGFCPHNSVRHLLSDASMVEHLSSMARLMRWADGRGGRRGDGESMYVVGVGLYGPGEEHVVESVMAGRSRGGGGGGVVSAREVIEFIPPALSARGRESRIERAHKHVSVKTREGEREYINSYALRTYTLEQWARVLKRSGLAERAVVDGRGVAMDAGRIHYAYRVLVVG